MKKFKVIASSITYYALEIEAENEDAAWDLAHDADGGDFTPVDQGDWEIYSVSEVQQ